MKIPSLRFEVPLTELGWESRPRFLRRDKLVASYGRVCKTVDIVIDIELGDGGFEIAQDNLGSHRWVEG